MTEITLRQRYRLTQQIGRGGEGTVYRAETSNGRAVAVKELHGLYLDLEQHHLESQLHVLQNLEGIPGIPQIQERGFIGGRYYIVSQLIEGDSLEQMVASGKRFNLQEAKEFMTYMLETMQCCHERGIIIRDIKPENIKTNGRPWIVDINALGDAYAESQTLAVGTLGYAAPEQKDCQAVFASDIYSLGKTVYRMITGRTVSGTKELNDQDFAVMRQIDSGLAGIIQKMCQPELERRYGSAAEVLHDLEIGHVTAPLVAVAQPLAVQRPTRLSWWQLLLKRRERIGDYSKVRYGNGYVIIDRLGNLCYGTAERPLTKEEATFTHPHNGVTAGEDPVLLHHRDGHTGLLHKDGSFHVKTVAGVDYIPLKDQPLIVWNGKKYTRYHDCSNWPKIVGLTEDGERMPEFLTKATVVHGLRGDYAVIPESETLVRIVDKNLNLVFGGTQTKFLQYSSAGGLEVMVFDTATHCGAYLPIVVGIDGNMLYNVKDTRGLNYIVDLSYTKPAATSDGRVFRQLDKRSPSRGTTDSTHVIADQHGTIVWRGYQRVTDMQITNPNILRIQLDGEFLREVDVSDARKAVRIRPH